MSGAPERVAIVTGGGQGIGRAIAARLAEKHAVFVLETDEEAGQDAAASPSGNVTWVPCDVSDEPSVREAVSEVAGRHGRIDALVNNAGLADPETGPIESLCLETWNRYLGTNLTGVFLCTKHAVPHLRKSCGAIVNLASTRARQSEPDTEAYAASKGGIVALTHALAISLGPDIRVNSISPGWVAVESWQKPSVRQAPGLRDVDHRQHPVGRVGRPEDIAELADFLLSDRASFITGQDFVADGGMSRRMIYAD